MLRAVNERTTMCRPADDCKVHFHAHLHPRFTQDFRRQLTIAEQVALLAAVERRGRHSWEAVAADVGLQWPHWRLLQCYHAAVRDTTGACDEQQWDAEQDAKLIKAAIDLTGTSNKRRRVPWLVRAPAAGSAVVIACVLFGHCRLHSAGAAALCRHCH